jgi:two-component system, OmpR family, response regulator
VSEARILIAEDDDELRGLVVRGLREEGFDVQASATATGVRELAKRTPPDAMVVDIGLPDADGRDLCQALRADGLTSPVLFLTARDALPDRLSGFAAGGDDYLVKPFSFEELVARLRAQLRRGTTKDGRTVPGLVVDPATHAAGFGDASVVLTPTEFRLLGALVTYSGDTVRRRQLIQAGWPHGAIVHENTLDAYVARLRRKLRTLPGAPSITTVHGVGYTIR